MGVSFALPMFYFFLQKMNQCTILINNFNKNKLSYKWPLLGWFFPEFRFQICPGSYICLPSVETVGTVTAENLSSCLPLGSNLKRWNILYKIFLRQRRISNTNSSTLSQNLFHASDIHVDCIYWFHTFIHFDKKINPKIKQYLTSYSFYQEKITHHKQQL